MRLRPPLCVSALELPDVYDSSTSEGRHRGSTHGAGVKGVRACALRTEQGSRKSAVLNSLIGHPVLPTGENGATRASIVVDLQREPGLSTKSIVLQIDSKSQQVFASQ
ncbi:hypothetical protein ZWY2020_017316 [Hordeum vulgare]|nr:hypothetical protein ZWY2020_017316 [Hordeum vulgare]